MNVLKLPYYKELVRKMVLYTQSKNHKQFLLNIMHLLVAIAEELPTFPVNKIQVLYSCAMRNVLYHFMDSDEIIKNAAIETMAKLCMIKNNTLLNAIFTVSFVIKKVLNCKYINIFRSKLVILRNS